MSVLYRTHRPQRWAEIIGQEHIVSALRESIANKRVAHAYLFSGSRGTGKTTTARILARELGTAAEDIYEIDAASNRGIDDIRSLREHVSVSPFRSIYKVYIIDEVHMLSKDAWNALLKTLEEPPTHVVFILATTELDKVPETIISRCQTFTFRRPGREVLRKEVSRVADKEGYKLDAGAADLIALLGDGSFRDALGMLEKVIAASKDKKLTRPEVEAITGAPRAALVQECIAALVSHNADAALATIREAEKSGISMMIFVTLLLEKCRLILLAQTSASAQPAMRERFSADEWEFVEAQAGQKNMTAAILSALLKVAEATPRAAIETLPLELAIIDICG